MAEECTYQLSFAEGAESHIRGKLPLQLTIFRSDEPVLKVFCKPRSARIDDRVVRLFNELNGLSSADRICEFDLPVYQIYHPRWAREGFSIWEFIEGAHWEMDSPELVVKTNIDSGHRAPLMQQLTVLDAVCRYLSISDLSADNVIFSGLNSQPPKPKVVPIDLESIQPGRSTGLLLRPYDEIKFSPKAKDLIDACKVDIFKLPHRFVPISTSSFLGGLTAPLKYRQSASDTMKALKRANYNPVISAQALELLILKDYVNSDVPYLRIRGSHLYYVSVDEETLVGESSHESGCK